MASFLDDLANFGSGLLDDVGETAGDALGTLINPSKDVQANPATRPQQNLVADNHGNTVTQPQGSVPQQQQSGFAGFTQKELMIGGGVAALLLIVLLKR